MDKSIEKLLKSSLDVAEEKFKSAKILHQEGQYDDAVSRAYYAAFHAAKALLLTEDVQVRTHEGTLQMFGLHFVKTGKFPKHYGKYLRNLQDDREAGDYAIFSTIDKEDSETALQETEAFLSQVRKYLTSL